MAGGRTYFARVGVDLPHHGVFRRNEARCSELAAATGIAPKVVHAGDGILVTEFIRGTTLVQGEPVDEVILRRLAAVLMKLHQAPTPDDLPPFDPIAVSHRYLKALPPATLSDEQIRRACEILHAAPTLRSRCLIHADLVPENVIVADNRLWLVDWEYAGCGDPAVDLALVATHFGIPDSHTESFVIAYGDADPVTVRALQPIIALREALWCKVQIQAAGAQGDLAEYTRLCWRRIGVER
jgi:thiamine kinase-like enzyme